MDFTAYLKLPSFGFKSSGSSLRVQVLRGWMWTVQVKLRFEVSPRHPPILPPAPCPRELELAPYVPVGATLAPEAPGSG